MKDFCITAFMLASTICLAISAACYDQGKLSEASYYIEVSMLMFLMFWQTKDSKD